MTRSSELLRDPQVRAVSLAVLISGVGGGAVPLALVLLVREQSGSFAKAGAVVAALGVAVGIFNPIRGRLVDRQGHRWTLAPLALLHACALVALVALAVRDAPTWALVVMAVVAGAAPAPLMSSLRALWRDLVPGPTLQPAYALQAVLTEALFVASPLLAAFLVAAWSAQLAVVVLATVEFAGVVAFTATLIGFVFPRSHTRWLGPPGIPGSRPCQSEPLAVSERARAAREQVCGQAMTGGPRPRRSSQARWVGRFSWANGKGKRPTPATVSRRT